MPVQFSLYNHADAATLSSSDFAAGLPVANRVAPGKRPRSSMSPLLVFDKHSGELEMSLGSPGGSAIINYVGKTLLGTQDWGLNLQQAINLPNFGSRNGPTELEQGIFMAAYGSPVQRRRRVLAVALLGIKHTLRGLLFSWPAYVLALAAAVNQLLRDRLA